MRRQSLAIRLLVLAVLAGLVWGAAPFATTTAQAGNDLVGAAVHAPASPAHGSSSVDRAAPSPPPAGEAIEAEREGGAQPVRFRRQAESRFRAALSRLVGPATPACARTAFEASFRAHPSTAPPSGV